MTVFILCAALLVAAALAILLPPLWRGASVGSASADRREANLAIFRDQWAELAREKAEGSLAGADFAQAERELRRRLLEEIPADSADARVGVGGTSRKTAMLLVLLLPLLAVGGYLLLGTPQALNPLATALPGKMTPEQIQGMVVGLAERLKAKPDDTEGWLMLARSYKTLGRSAEAAEIYARVEPAMAEDPDFLADYADLLAMLAGGNLDGKPMALVDRALHLDPNHVVALWLAGTASFDKGGYADAVIFWQRAVKLLSAESSDARTLNDGIAEAQRRMGITANPAKTVAGRVELAPALAERASPDDTVFIFARPTDGTRAPVAVAKVHVSDLPFAFVLDDSSAVMADKRISSQSRVMVEARLSRSGTALPQDGDLQSKVQTVRVGERKLRLLIDQVMTR
jgi:cytochrome c-type biogenesis protein CcmH